jgi:hypothetical protein
MLICCGITSPDDLQMVGLEGLEESSVYDGSYFPTCKVTLTPNVLLLRYTVTEDMWVDVLSTEKYLCLD